MSISNGLPGSRADWPHEVLEACEAFACGDVVEAPPYFYFADPQFAVMERTKDYFDHDYAGPDIIDATDWAAPYGVVTTQTCDVGEIDFDRPSFPFISVAPIFDATDVINASNLSLLRSGKRIGPFVHLPLLTDCQPGFWVADFRLELPIEKSWLVGRTPIKGFATEEAARMIPSALHDLRSRPAWAKVVNVCVEGGLRRHLDELKKGNRDLYKRVVGEIDEVGVRADSMLEPSLVTIAAFTAANGLSADVRSWWVRTTEAIASDLATNGVQAGATETYSLGTCPVLTYRQYSPVSLGGKYSPR